MINVALFVLCLKEETNRTITSSQICQNELNCQLKHLYLNTGRSSAAVTHAVVTLFNCRLTNQAVIASDWIFHLSGIDRLFSFPTLSFLSSSLITPIS